MRVFLKVIDSTGSKPGLVEFFTLKLDKAKHRMEKESFVAEVLEKIRRSRDQSDPTKPTDVQPEENKGAAADKGVSDSQLRLWLAPNHQLVDLEPIEADDMLVLGTLNDLRQFENLYGSGSVAMVNQK